MGCVRMLKNNYAHPDLAANLDYSSENPTYPGDNLFDPRRKRVWRSQGFFEVKTGENSLVFRETIGVDLTATVAVGTYASRALFMAAVKTALDAAGASTYTVQADTTTLKTEIVSDGSGGGNIFQLRAAASSADLVGLLGFDAVDLTGALTYEADQLVIHEYEYIEIDMGVPSLPTDFVLSGPRNQNLKLTADAEVLVEGNSTQNWTAPEFSQAANIGDHVVYLGNEEGLHTSALRYWRIKITDQENTYGYVEANLVFLGRAIILTRGCVVFPLGKEIEDFSETVYSEGRQSFSEELEKSEVETLDWRGLTKEDVEALGDFYELVGTHTPFFITYDDAERFSTDSTRWVKWSKFLRQPTMTLIRHNNWRCDMQLREEL